MMKNDDGLDINRLDPHLIKAGLTITEIANFLLEEFFRRSESSVAARIIAGVIARSIRTTSSIVVLCNNNDVQGAWILHRTLVERLFHLAHLGSTDSYLEFEKWSFFEQAKRAQKSLGDPLFCDRTKGSAYQLSPREKERFSTMQRDPPKWRRGKAEDMAKHLGLKFLYDYAYDYASMHIHPMANDGDLDLLMPAQQARYCQEIELATGNSLLALTLVLQEAMNSPPVKWAKVAYDMVDAARAYIRDPSSDYLTPFKLSARLRDSNGLSALAD